MTVHFTGGKLTKPQYLELILIVSVIGLTVGATHWLETTQHKEQLTALKQEVHTLQQETENLKRQNLSLQKEFNSLEQHTIQMKSDMQVLTACISSLKEPADNLRIVSQDFIKARPEYNLTGRLLIGRDSLQDFKQSWDSESCNAAQSIVERKASHSSSILPSTPVRSSQYTSPESLLHAYAQSLTHRNFSELAKIHPNGDIEGQQNWLEGNDEKAPITTIQVIGQPRRIATSPDKTETILRATLQYCRQDGSGSTDIKNYTLIEERGSWRLDSMTVPEDVTLIQC